MPWTTLQFWGETVFVCFLLHAKITQEDGRKAGGWREGQLERTPGHVPLQVWQATTSASDPSPVVTDFACWSDVRGTAYPSSRTSKNPSVLGTRGTADASGFILSSDKD